jgi:hypothetical protein
MLLLISNFDQVIMLSLKINKYVNRIRQTAINLLRIIIVSFWLINFLSVSFISFTTEILAGSSELPVSILIDSDLTSPGKLFCLQNETLRIIENLKIQSYYDLNTVLLVKSGNKDRLTSEIPHPEDNIFLMYVFIETTNPRSPPTSLS